MYDVIVIGGGVVGGTLLRALSRYDLSLCMVEKSDDVCMGQSKANSGIVHAGFDAKEGSLKAKFNVAGNRMMPDLCRELGVKYENNGSLVVAFCEEEMRTLSLLKERGEKNGVEGLSLIEKEELFALEPHISKDAVGALLAKTGGIVCPYELTIAAVGNAMDNGAELFTAFEVVKAEKTADGFLLFSKDGRTVSGKTVVNCAGLGGEAVSRLFGDDSVKIGGRRGEYILLDKECAGFVSHTLFFTPTEKGKGILVSPTVDHNILLGPTAEETETGETLTTRQGLDDVTEKAAKMCENVPFFQSITSFSGVRAYSDTHDFVIKESEKCPGLLLCIGIESPGLTSAPAIAEYVTHELIGKKFPLKEKEDFIATRTPDTFFKDMAIDEKNALIACNPAFGRMVCRCEQVTEGEIVRAIRCNPPARTVDAVKRRTRMGMGRCQGGFCTPAVTEILARELGVSPEKIKKSEGNSYLLFGRTKG